MTGIVIAHGAALDTILRHKPLWDIWFDDYEFVVPEDDKLPNMGHRLNTVGLSEHNGLHAVERMRAACSIASGYASAAVLEYDTLVFGPPMASTEGVIMGSYLFVAPTPIFASAWWLHSPWQTSQEDWRKLADCPAELEGRFPDRWLSAAADSIGIIGAGFTGGYSQNSLDRPEYVAAAIRAVEAGASAIHGVKTLSVFEKLKAARYDQDKQRELDSSHTLAQTGAT